jgi:hypothetical protein
VLARAERAHPGDFIVLSTTPSQSDEEADQSHLDEVSFPSPIEPVLEHGDDVIVEDATASPIEAVRDGAAIDEVTNASGVKHVNQPTAGRRGGKKQHSV